MKLQTSPFLNLDADFFEEVQPTEARDARLLLKSSRLMDQLGWKLSDEQKLLDWTAGRGLQAQDRPFASVYAGHQFGHFVPQLGDGRAITLGDACDQQGRPWELQLKGAGLTKYSRRGDGRAVLRSSLREFLMSEAMAALGVPTTRALSLVSSNERVARETFEPRGLVIRVAPHFLRFGHFEFWGARQNHAKLESLLEYAYQRERACGLGLSRIDLQDWNALSIADRAVALLENSVSRTAEMIAQWQAFGFEHGVMNSDNFSISGLTLDYGPFGMMDAYDPSWVVNHTDSQGRYAFDQQPRIGLFNLRCLAQALLPISDEQMLIGALKKYEPYFIQTVMELFVRKFGWLEFDAEDEGGDRALVDLWLSVLGESRSDYTLSWRGLSDWQAASGPSPRAEVQHALGWDRSPRWPELEKKLLARYAKDTELRASKNGIPVDSILRDRSQEMNRLNPRFILRNHLAEKAIQSCEQGDASYAERLLRVLESPYEAGSESEISEFGQPPAPGSEAVQLSCSS